MRAQQLFYLALLALSSSCFANQKIPENETTVFNETFSWQAMASFSVGYNPSLIIGVEQDDILDYGNISLLIDVYYEGFFIQSNHRKAALSRKGAEIGYQLVVTPKWELDIISKSYLAGYNPKAIIKDQHKSIPTLENLSNRNPAEGLGLRYSRYHRNSVLALDFSALAPLSSANGWIADAFYSYVLPYRNWDINLSVGYTFYSEKVMDYFYGVNSDEVSVMRPLHQAKSGYRVQFELFAQHPLSENWTFNGGVTQSFYSSSTKDSPLVDRQQLSQVMLGVIYVF